MLALPLFGLFRGELSRESRHVRVDPGGVVRIWVWGGGGE